VAAVQPTTSASTTAAATTETTTTDSFSLCRSQNVDEFSTRKGRNNRTSEF
jgi:hypothetical protein